MIPCLLAVGCGFSQDPPPVTVDPDKIVIVRTGPATITVTGLPGAVFGGKATTLTLTVNKPQVGSPSPLPSPGLYRLQHLGSHIPVTSTFVSINDNGGFTTLAMGDNDHVIEPNDELDITPQNGLVQAGYLLFVNIP